VRRAIDFNEQPFPNTDKVRNVRADRVLDAKVLSLNLTTLQAGPEDALGIRELRAQRLCARSGL
jgi:hypothetical protein